MEEKTTFKINKDCQADITQHVGSNKDEEMWHGLYGSWIDKNHCVGYCKFHKGYMTFKQIKKKECLQKQCKALEKLPHQFWKQREIIKQKKKIKRLSK